MKNQQHQHEYSSMSIILSSLSTDLLIQILDRLPESSDLKSFRLVCKSFSLAESIHRRSIKILRREFLLPLLRRYPAVETLDLSACPSVADEALAAAIESNSGSILAKLRRIDLSRARGVSSRALEAVAAACPRLEAVDMTNCVGVGDREAAAVAAARLREVRFEKCVEVTDVGLARVAVGCGGRLERLGIRWCREISDIGIDLLVKKCRELKVLDVSYLKITNKSLQSISSLEKLEVLLMVGCTHIDDDGLRYLNNGRNSLRTIDVSRCDNVTSSGLTSVIEGHKSIQNLSVGNCFPAHATLFLKKLNFLKTTLNTLKLDGSQVSALSLQAIGRNCKNLTEISLSKCQGVNDEGICELVDNCNNLVMIDLTCCHLLTDKALSAISNNCKRLECLRLESCSLITEKGLGQIGNFCTDLKEMDLTDCSINDAALKGLSSCSKLMVLKLGLCTSITSDGLSHVGWNCRNLRELDLYRCTGVNDDGLASLAVGCKKLKIRNLRYCNKITDHGMKHLSSLSGLSELEMRGLHHVTSLGITAIARGCSSLSELDLKKCYAVDDAAMSALVQYSPNIRQINISYCAVTAVGLWKLLGNLRRLEDATLVHLTRVPVGGFELGLRASCGRFKKLKLDTGLRNLLSPVLIQMLKARGCRVRCVDKPLMLGN